MTCLEDVCKLTLKIFSIATFSPSQILLLYVCVGFRVPHCPSFIKDCGHLQPGGAIERIAEKLGLLQDSRNDEMSRKKKYTKENLHEIESQPNNDQSEFFLKRKKRKRRKVSKMRLMTKLVLKIVIS